MQKDVSLDGNILYLSDCLVALKDLPDNSIDSIVCDPPYGLGKQPDLNALLTHWLNNESMPITGKGFMGKDWDVFVPQPAVWKECLRVLKPGGHLIAFFGARTYDLGALCVFQASVTTHFRQMTGHFRVSVTTCFRISVTAFAPSSEMRFA